MFGLRKIERLNLKGKDAPYEMWMCFVLGYLHDEKKKKAPKFEVFNFYSNVISELRRQNPILLVPGPQYLTKWSTLFESRQHVYKLTSPNY